VSEAGRTEEDDMEDSGSVSGPVPDPSTLGLSHLTHKVIVRFVQKPELVVNFLEIVDKMRKLVLTVKIATENLLAADPSGPFAYQIAEAVVPSAEMQAVNR
jgi:hypothetical protein